MTTATKGSSIAPVAFATNRSIRRLLLVDDNRWICNALSDRLREHLADVRVTAAGNGREALDILKAGTIDMLITEVDLPGMDGYELIGQVRQRRPAMPIMVTTDDCSPKVVELLLSLGVNRWIEKPFDGKTIAAAIRTELDRLA